MKYEIGEPQLWWVGKHFSYRCRNGRVEIPWWRIGERIRFWKYSKRWKGWKDVLGADSRDSVHPRRRSRMDGDVAPRVVQLANGGVGSDGACVEMDPETKGEEVHRE